MSLPVNQPITVSRKQCWFGLIVAAIVLLTAIGTAAILFSFSTFALLLPLPAAILFLAFVFAVVNEPATAQTPAVDINEPALAVFDTPPARPELVERTVTVDDEREIYGIYATLQTISSSLSLSDTLNLVADRLGRLIPGGTVLFALAETETEPLSVAAAFGRYGDLFALGEEIGDEQAGAVARTDRRAVSGMIWPKRVRSEQPAAEQRGWPAIAAPIIFESAVYGSITLFRGEGRGFVEAETAQLESVAIFASAGIHQALTQKQSRDTAMLDPIMQLPNVRAAFTIVDQRIAESLRRRSDEPLGLICVRIATTVDGDRVLRDVGNLVGPQLRHMDILTRGEGHELLIVLPRSGSAEAALVANRILRALKTTSPALTGVAHLGLASYPADGATSSELFSCARDNSHAPNSQALDRSFDNVVLVDEWR